MVCRPMRPDVLSEHQKNRLVFVLRQRTRNEQDARGAFEDAAGQSPPRPRPVRPPVRFCHRITEKGKPSPWPRLHPSLRRLDNLERAIDPSARHPFRAPTSGLDFCPFTVNKYQSGAKLTGVRGNVTPPPCLSILTRTCRRQCARRSGARPCDYRHPLARVQPQLAAMN